MMLALAKYDRECRDMHDAALCEGDWFLRDFASKLWNHTRRGLNGLELHWMGHPQRGGYVERDKKTKEIVDWL